MMLGPTVAGFVAFPSPPLVDASDDGMRVAVATVERLLGYSFRDRRLLEEALTHPSYQEHPTYQRLEFVGDAALGMAFTNYVYLTNPDAKPGRLSTLRAANISTEKLARAAVRHDLYRLIRRNSPDLDRMVAEFTRSVLRELEDGEDLEPYGGCSIKAPKVLADIVESIAAAVYIDCDFNLELLWKVTRGMLEPIITLETLREQPVTTLYQFCRKNKKSIHFKHRKIGKMNVMNVFVDGQPIGIGSSKQKIIAKLNATRDALEKLSCPKAGFMDIEPALAEGDGAGEQIQGSKQKLHKLCNKKSAGHFLSDKQQVRALIHSLPDNWEHTKINLTHNDSIKNFTDVARYMELKDECFMMVRLSGQVFVAKSSSQKISGSKRKRYWNKKGKIKEGRSKPKKNKTNRKKKCKQSERKKDKTKTKCYTCGTLGHFARECSEQKKTQELQII